jgi:hypothetical protein
MRQAVVPGPISLSTAERRTVVLEAVNQAHHRAEVVQQMLRAVAVLHKLHKRQVAVVAVKNLRTDDRYQNALITKD